MSRAKLPMHGAATHGEHGPDPVAGFGGIRFNVDNEGGWLYIIANDSTDIDYGTEGIVIVDKSGQGVLLLCDPSGSQFGLSILPSFASIGSPARGPSFSVDTGGTVAVHLKTGNKFQVLNNANAPIFEVRADGSVHIPTGTAIIADL